MYMTHNSWQEVDFRVATFHETFSCNGKTWLICAGVLEHPNGMKASWVEDRKMVFSSMSSLTFACWHWITKPQFTFIYSGFCFTSKANIFFKSMLLYNSYMATTVCFKSGKYLWQIWIKTKEKKKGTLVSCMKVKRVISHPPHPCFSAMPYNVHGTYYTTCMRREHWHWT